MGDGPGGSWRDIVRGESDQDTFYTCMKISRNKPKYED